MAEWISVNDQLPNVGQKVDIYNTRDGRVPDVTFNGMVDGYPEWSAEYMRWSGYVTHWMPLPEPPKEVQG